MEGPVVLLRRYIFGSVLVVLGNPLNPVPNQSMQLEYLPTERPDRFSQNHPLLYKFLTFGDLFRLEKLHFLTHSTFGCSLVSLVLLRVYYLFYNMVFFVVRFRDRRSVQSVKEGGHAHICSIAVKQTCLLP